MLERPVFRKNSFHETMLGLEYRREPDRPADLFSRACVEQFQEFNTERFGYLFFQVFEPNVLREVALLEGQSYVRLMELIDPPTPATTQLATLVENASDLSVVGLVNLAAALISISRFDPALRVLVQAQSRAASPRHVFETEMLAFVVANRRDDGTGPQRAFFRMRQAIETDSIPADRVLDACSQAIVWYLKRQELPEAEFHWYLATGSALTATPGRLHPGSISSWYRALAMLPAAQGAASTTRQYMEYAREAADESFARKPRAYERQFMKTYLESSLKEHMYVTRDPEKAEEAGRALIDLDPVWAPSYGELAEAYLKFNKPAQAAALFEQAVAVGPPYVGHHLLCAARCREALGDSARALAHYLTLSELVPENESVLLAGREVAGAISAEARRHFEDALERLKNRIGSGSSRLDEGR